MHAIKARQILFLHQLQVVKRPVMGMEGSEGAVTTREPIYDRFLHLSTGNAVVLFTISSCCMCHVVKQLLYGLGVGPAIVELDHDEDGQEIQDVLLRLAGGGFRHALPAVFVGGKYLGSIETVIACHINGTLVPLLKDSGALWL